MDRDLPRTPQILGIIIFLIQRSLASSFKSSLTLFHRTSTVLIASGSSTTCTSLAPVGTNVGFRREVSDDPRFAKLQRFLFNQIDGASTKDYCSVLGYGQFDEFTSKHRKAYESFIGFDVKAKTALVLNGAELTQYHCQ